VKAVLNMLRDAGSDADILLEQSMGRNGTEDETEREEEARVREGIEYAHPFL